MAAARFDLGQLVGSGDRIALVAAPFVVAGVALNVLAPDRFGVGGPPAWLAALSLAVLVPGVAIWLWSVALVLRDVPRGRLITEGPFAWLKHPIYTAVALLVLPSVGFLLDTWLGAFLGAVLYLAARWLAPAEELELARRFGEAWRTYERQVRLRAL